MTFWGARIIKMAPDSPLRALSLRPGDVITRLDGVPIWTDMFRTGPGQPFQLPNLEEHFGGTEVRYIAQGTNRVRVRQINIDTEEPEDDGIAPIRP